MNSLKPFLSDNTAAVHPKVWEAMRAADEADSPYDGDALSGELDARFTALFGRDCAALWTITGTAANCLALSTLCQPHGGVVCHEEAHIEVDEGGAPGFFLHGAKLILCGGDGAKLTPGDIAALIAPIRDDVHQVQPHAVAITQASEYGRSYTPAELKALCDYTLERGLGLHMDGARFANALAALDVTPAEMTWKRGVDILSFGGTKNGCWCAEALVFFNPEMARQVPFIRKRGAHLFSKSRFIAAQFAAYLENGLWLELASHSNAMASRLREAITASSKARLAWDGQTNEVFAILPTATSTAAQDKGARFYDWPVPKGVENGPGPDETLIRLVTSFATSETDVDRFAELLG